MAVYGLTRVSTDGQEDGTSREDQARKIRGLCMTAGLPDPTIVHDTVSGSVRLDERENAGPIVRGLERGDVIIATKLDRVFRNATDALSQADDFKERGIALYLIDMGSDPVTNAGTARMFFGMLALMAEFERGRIRERTMDGRKAKTAKLGFVGGKVPFGYRVEGKGKAAFLVEDEEQQAHMVRIKQLAEDGLSLRKIRDTIGVDVSPMTISKIINA